MPPSTHCMTLAAPMLQRGFWLYVWRVETHIGNLLYVGRTGDNSSPHASAPYTRMSQHLGFATNQNALRARLNSRGIIPETCKAFHLIAHGPIYPEIEALAKDDRASLMERHMPFRNIVGAMEKALCDELKAAGYDVINSVSWKHEINRDIWKTVREAFVEHFPKLACGADHEGN